MARLSDRVWRPLWVLAALFAGSNGQLSAGPLDLGTEVCAWSSRGPLFPLHNSSCPLPIDDDEVEDGASWAPWSYPPTCVEFQARNRPAGRSNDAVKYCVFTSVPFRGGHGISLITTPELASSLSVGLDDSVVPPAIRDHPASYLSPLADEALFEVKELPNRGLGSVAKHRIRQWDTILVGFPAILAQMDFMDVLSPEQIRDVLAPAIGQLPEEQREEILSLARSTGGGIIQDILQTNIFGVEIEGVMHMALIPEASRTNHGCRPNAFWRFNEHTLAMEMIAFRDINRGEEITFSYTPLGLTYEGRKNVLGDWGFECKCPLCTSSRKEVKLSDERRDRIHDIHGILAQEEGISGKKVANLADELMKLLDQESLWPQLVVYYEVIARAYMEARDLEKATKYADMCEKEWIKYGGREHENVDGVQQLWRDLEMARLAE